MQAALGWQDVLAGKLPQARAQIDPALAQLRRLAPGSAELAEALAFAGDAMVFESDALGHDGPGQAAYALRQESTAMRARLWGPKSVRLARNRFQLGMSLWSQGRLALASDELARAEQDMAQAMGPTHTDTLEIALQRGWLEVLMDLNPDALRRVKEAAQTLMAREHDIDPRTHFDAVTAMGESLLYTGDMASALPYLKRSLILVKSLEGRIANTGRPETNMAWYLQDTGQLDKARTLLNQTLEKLSQSWGAEHEFTQGVAERLHDLDQLLSGQDMVKRNRIEIESAFQAIAKGRRQNFYAMTVLTANSQLGQLESSENHWTQALHHYEVTMTALRNAHPDSPYLMVTRARMGKALVAIHRLPQAQQLLILAEARLARYPKLGPHLEREVRALRDAISNEAR
jgi:tetratricopeptide (TPR) repeat protein